MKKPNFDDEIKVIVVNPPSPKEADNRVAELALYLEKIWTSSDIVE